MKRCLGLANAHASYSKGEGHDDEDDYVDECVSAGYDDASDHEYNDDHDVDDDDYDGDGDYDGYDFEEETYEDEHADCHDCERDTLCGLVIFLRSLHVPGRLGYPA